MRPTVVAVILTLLVAVIIVAGATALQLQQQRRVGVENFESNIERPLTVLHISPSSPVVLLSDEARGPTAAQLSSTRVVRELGRRGLSVATHAVDPDMSIVDALTAAEGSLIVVPLLAPIYTRTLTLFAAAEAPAVLPTGKEDVSVTAVCLGQLEADLFAIAWAAAGGSDRSGAAATLVAGRYDDRVQQRGLLIAVAWGCPGSRAVLDAEAAAKRWSRSGRARTVAYGDRDGAQHQVAARAPSLRLMPSVVPGESAVLSAPSLVVVNKKNEAAGAIAAEIVRMAMADDERDLLSRVAFTSAAAHVPLSAATSGPLGRMSRHVKSLIDASMPYERAAVPVLEQFESGPSPGVVELIPSYDVEGRFVEGEDDARLAAGHVSGVSLRRGDRLLLTRQTRASEDGSYVVIEEGEHPRVVPHVTLSPLRYRTSLDLDKGSNAWTWIFEFEPAGTDASALARVGDAVVWGPTRTPGVLVAPGRVEVPDAAVHADADAERFVHDWLHPLARCSADPIVPTRELCDAKGGFWDHPCVRDDECPFYTADTSPPGETTYRGGCLSGYCEMPIGVRRSPNSFRHPNRRDSPICACPGQSRTRAASEACCGATSGPIFELQRPV